MAATPISQRRRDLAYLIYFIIHIVVLFLVDLSPLYPDAYRPALSTRLLAYQAEVYQDRFFAIEIPFFEFFRWMEAVVHVPVSFWALRGLVRGDAKIPLVLFAYALQTVLTTATCMYDFSQWEGVEAIAKWHLASLYGPYLLISTYMAVDMWGRISGDLKELQVLRMGKKRD